jgi:hypothetical protein
MPSAARADHARTCLVAVDGTRAGVDALVWGLRHAAAHDMGVEVLTVWPDHRSALVHDVPGHFCAPRWSARVAQQEAIRKASEAVPEVPIVATTLENADAAEAIVRASARHDLVVLGSSPAPGPRRFTERVVEDAHCDVVVVAGPAAPTPAAPTRP